MTWNAESNPLSGTSSPQIITLCPYTQDFANKQSLLPTRSAILVFARPTTTIRSLILLVRKESANLEGICEAF
jgi:hypothetical protein